jgi:hypothetical protein
MTLPGYEWRGVLAGAYKTEKSMEKGVDHLVNIETGAVLCKRIKPERMCDISYGNPPHCPECERRAEKRIQKDTKMKAKRSKPRRRTKKRKRATRRRKLLGRVRKARARTRKHRSKIMFLPKASETFSGFSVGDRARVIDPDDAYEGSAGDVVAIIPGRWVVLSIDGDRGDFKPSQLRRL